MGSKGFKVLKTGAERRPCPGIAMAAVFLANSACTVEVESLEVTGNFDPDHIVQVAVTMAPSDWDALRLQSRSFVSELSGACMDQPHENPKTLQFRIGPHVLWIQMRIASSM